MTIQAPMTEIADLQARWTSLYREQLPALAKSRDPVQGQWPVHLDHCFARLILDNAVGVDQPWTSVIKQPAVRNMSIIQLRCAITMGEQIATGEASLSNLNERSLRLRGKSEAAKKRKASPNFEVFMTKKPKRTTGTISCYFKAPSQTRDAEKHRADGNVQPDDEMDRSEDVPADCMDEQLKMIANSKLTTFRKQILSLLCQVPRGSYTTYAAMSDYVSSSSHKTCARAVGNAMRNNPFAPEVPCHRVLAADGSLGGFGGDWGESGKHASKKKALLRAEGVRFDGKGKVVGKPFSAFKI